MAAYGCCGEYNEHAPNCVYVRDIAHVAALAAEVAIARERLGPAGYKIIEEVKELRKERDELKALHEQAVKLVMPGECDSSDAYLKILRELKEERDAYRDYMERIEYLYSPDLAEELHRILARFKKGE